MALGNKSVVNADMFRPIKDNVFVCDLDSGPHITAAGIILPDDNMSESGIRPRWGKVWAIGPDVQDIKVGEWVFIEHGRWTNSIDIQFAEGRIRVWKIEWPKAALLAASDDPREKHLSDMPNVKYLQSEEHHVRSVAPAIIRKRD